MNQPPVRRAVVLALVAASLLAAFFVQRSMIQSFFADYSPGDFAATRCATLVALAHHDPYQLEPLRTCEHNEVAGMVPGRVVPAPYPPFAFPLFAPVMALPLAIGSKLWLASQILCCGIVAAILARMYGGNPVIVGGVLLVAALPILMSGQIELHILLGIAFAALFLRSGKDFYAVITASLLLVKPQLGLPVLLGTLCAGPSLRLLLPAALAIAAFGAASIALVGSAATAMWFLTLPVHAVSEWPLGEIQFSLSSAFAHLGMGTRFSLALANAIFLAAVVLSIVVAKRLSMIYVDRSFFVIAPAGICVFFLSFLHLYNFVIALPLYAALVHYLSLQKRPWGLGAAAISGTILLGVMTAGAIGASQLPPRVAPVPDPFSRLMANVSASEAALVWNQSIPAPAPEIVGLFHALHVLFPIAFALLLAAIFSALQLRRPQVRLGVSPAAE